MKTYNLYKCRDSGLGFVIVAEEESNFTRKYLDDLSKSLQNGDVEFEEVFDSKEALKEYIKDKSIKLSDSSQVDLS